MVPTFEELPSPAEETELKHITGKRFTFTTYPGLCRVLWSQGADNMSWECDSWAVLLGMIFVPPGWDIWCLRPCSLGSAEKKTSVSYMKSLYKVKEKSVDLAGNKCFLYPLARWLLPMSFPRKSSQTSMKRLAFSLKWMMKKVTSHLDGPGWWIGRTVVSSTMDRVYL